MRMTEKEAQPDQSRQILLSDGFGIFGPAHASIIVGPGHQGRRHRSHPSPIIGRQWGGTHHDGGP